MKHTAASGPRRALVVSFHFYPDAAIGARRMSELSLALESAGWRVTVVCARPRAGGAVDAALGDRVAALDVRRVRVPPPIVMSVLRAVRRVLGRAERPARAAARDTPTGGPTAPRPSLVATLKRYYHSVEWLFDANKAWLTLVCCRLLGLRLTRRFDLVVSSGPPHGIHIPGLFAKRLFGAAWVMDMRDPLRRWVGSDHEPDSVNTRFRDFVEDAAARRWLRGADLVVCTAPGAAATALEHEPALGDRVEVIYNGFDGEATPPRFTPQGRLAFLYAGNLYYNRDPFPFLEALKEVVRGPEVAADRVTFTMVGDCEAWAGRSVRDWVREHDMAANVRVLGRVESAEVGRMLGETDVPVNFAQGQPLQIPAKTFDYLASGKEMLVIAEDDSDTARLVRESGLGRVAPPDDRAAIARAIRALYVHYVDGRADGTPHPKDAERFSRSRQHARYLDRIQGLGPMTGTARAARPAGSPASH